MGWPSASGRYTWNRTVSTGVPKTISEMVSPFARVSASGSLAVSVLAAVAFNVPPDVFLNRMESAFEHLACTLPKSGRLSTVSNEKSFGRPFSPPNFTLPLPWIEARAKPPPARARNRARLAATFA